MPRLTPDNSEMFINPYNFVSQNKEKVIRNAVEYGDLTGKITCRLKVKDKLALPDHNTSGRDEAALSGYTKEQQKQCYDFYKVNGKPVVPGSEIKGCIRSVYETVTHSCFSVVNSNVLSSRIPIDEANGNNPGLLVYENDVWCLYSAQKFKSSKLSKYHKKAEDGVKREWHLSGTDFKNLRTSYFFNGSYICDIDDKDIEKYEELLDIFLSNTTGSDEFENILKALKNDIRAKKSVPVFYKLDSNNKFEYLSPAQVSRKMFKNTVKDLLGSYSPDMCGVEIETSDGKYAVYCPACSLFGTIANTPLNGRISFSDAVEHKNVRISNSYINLPELSSPKITSVEFYSEFPGRGNGSERWDYDDEGVTLKGRKYYYHSPAKSEKFLGPRSVATRPALENSEFVFDVYFDKISETELKQLLWVLTLGENSVDSEYLHKLGFGKPVGYGSVKIVADKITLRKIDGEGYGITEKSFDDYNITDELFDDKKTVSQLKRILKYDYVINVLKPVKETEDDTIIKLSYPIADSGGNDDNSTAAHQWFTSNRTKRKFCYVLPGISTDDASKLALPSMKGTGDQAAAGNGGGTASQATSNNSTSKLEVGKHYTARCTKIPAGMNYAEFEVNGEKKQRIFNDHLPRNLRVGQEIWVTYKGKNDKGYNKYWVD